jgi:hypothetical protein
MMADLGVVSVLESPEPVLVGALTTIMTAFDHGDVLTMAPFANPVLVDGAYVIAGTLQCPECPPPAAPPTIGQLWPRGDHMHGA